MPERSPGLKVQAAELIATDTLKIQLLDVLINRCGDNDQIEVSIENLISLRIAFQDNAKLLQKQDKKIDDLNEQLFRT